MAKKPAYEELEKRVEELEKKLKNLSKSESEHQKSELLFKSIFDRSHQFALILNRDGTVLKINDLCRVVCGNLAEDVIGNPFEEAGWWKDFVDVREKTRLAIKEVLEGNIATDEVVFLDRDHQIHNGIRIFSPVKNDFDEIVMISVVGLDITDRKLMELALRESEKKYHSILETISEGIILQAASGEILTWNKGAEEIFGISAEDVIGHTSESREWHTIREDGTKYEGKDHPSMITLKTGRPCRNIIMGIYRSPNDLRWISVNTNPVFSANGSPPDAVAISFSDITEFKQSEDRLREQEKVLSDILDDTLSGYWDWNIPEKKEYLSPAFKKMFGYEDHELPNSPDTWQRLIFQEDLHGVFNIFDRHVKSRGKEPYYNEIRYHHKDGSTVWVICAGRVIEWAEDGSPIRMVGCHVDITALKKAEKKSLMLETAIDQAPVGIALADENISIYYCNPAGLDMRGGMPGDLVEIPKDAFKNWQVYKLSDEPYEIDDLPLVRAISKSELVREEFIVKHQDGTDHICDAVACPVFENQKVIGGIVIFLDISKRKKAEKELRLTKERLESLWNVTKIADSDIKTISDHILAEIQRITESEYAFYGFLTGDQKTMTLHAWSHNTMHDCQITDSILHFSIDKAGIWADAVRGKRILTLNDFSIDLPGKKGTPRGHVPLSRLMVVPLILDDKVHSIAAVANKQSEYTEEDEKQVESFLRNVQILVDRKRHEEEKIELTKRLQQAQKLESIGTLAGGIAHDFNNILSPIMIHCEMVVNDLPSDSPLQQNMKEIHKATERLRDLVKQILTIARKKEEEKFIIKSSPIIKEAVKFLRSTIPTTIDIQLITRAESDTILADPSQLSQIIMNLCTNAAHAMKENGGAIEIILENKEIYAAKPNKRINLKPGRYIILSVKDTGAGIKEEYLDKIFEPYFTTKEVGEGTGLGLSIIHGIVKSYGGDIFVESRVGEGACFTIYLPLAKKEVLPEEKNRQELPRGKNERILLVDDDESAVAALHKSLERLGYRVTSTNKSEEALERFKDDHASFDLVITDMTMPNKTGKELAMEIKGIAPEIPIILCTGFSDKIDENTAEEMGISSFIMKPIVMSELAKTIVEVLNQN